MKYATIVADPPWEYERTGVSFHDSDSGAFTGTGLPYETMSVEEIASLPVGGLADRQAHLYLWTTSHYLRDSFSILDAWGFTYAATLVWCKAPRGWMVGGTYASNVEFVQFATRNLGPSDRVELGEWLRAQRLAAGLRQKDVAKHWPSVSGGLTGCVANWELGLNAPTLGQWEQLKRIIGFGDEMDAEARRINEEKGESVALESADSRWFTWARSEHSAKPEAFMDMVERVSPAPRLELFARRSRLGWDTWGNEALEHVGLSPSLKRPRPDYDSRIDHPERHTAHGRPI